MVSVKTKEWIILLSVTMIIANGWKCNPNQVDFKSALSKLSRPEYGNYSVTGPFSFDYSGNVTSSAANPSTLYGGYRFNPPSALLPRGISGSAAIIFYLCIPPPVAYYSFSSTIELIIKNKTHAFFIESPLGPIVNQYDVNTVENINANDSNINIMTTLIHTADQQTWMDINTAFSETSSDLFSSLTLDAWRSQYNGKTLPFDITALYLVVARTVGFANADQEKEWYSTVQNTVYIVEQKTSKQISSEPVIPFENIEMPSKKSNINEVLLYKQTYDKFINAIINYYNNGNCIDDEYQHKIYYLESSAFYGDAYIDCISNKKYGYGYHSDVVYWQQVHNQSLPQAIIRLDPDHFIEDAIYWQTTNDLYDYLLEFKNKNNFFVFGGFDSTIEPSSAIYMNLNIQTEQSSIANMESFQFTGNGRYISSQFNRFFAAVLVIKGNDQFCIDGIECIDINLTVNDPFALVFRHYLNQYTQTGPDKDQLLQPFVIEFKTKRRKQYRALDGHHIKDINDAMFAESEEYKHSNKPIYYLWAMLFLIITFIITLFWCRHRKGLQKQMVFQESQTPHPNP